WYQAEPHVPFSKLPSLAERLRDATRPPLKLIGAHECESLKIIGRTPGLVAEPQDLHSFGNGWSADAQLFLKAQKVGDFVELVVRAKEPGARKIVLYATQAQDCGMLGFSVNGQDIKVSFDGYADKPAPSGPINLGVHAPSDGKFILRAQVI